MPTAIEDFEIEKPTPFSVERWGIKERKDAAYLEEDESPIIWRYASRPNRTSPARTALTKLISDSMAILECQDDADDGFISYSKETLDRAITFVTSYIELSERLFGISVPLPKLLPGPSGSIDVHWKNEKKELIVNIPADKSANALFYGDDYAKLFIKGALAASAPHPSILMWLLNY
jgi:hypothetical protein